MTQRTRGRTVATTVALASIAAYVLVTLLIVLPPNPVASSLSPVTKAASPFFSQKWDIFAPDIAKTNPQLRVQAQWRDESGGLVKSAWVNVTAVEFRSVVGSPVPSRIQKLSWNALGAYLERFRKLEEDQQAVVRDTFIERTDEGFRAKPSEDLVLDLAFIGDSRADVINLLRYDYMLKEYATYFATATFGKDVERVRWEIVRERPNDFDRRFDSTAQYDPTVLRFGWRQADDVIRPDVLATFDDVVARYGGEQ